MDLTFLQSGDTQTAISNLVTLLLTGLVTAIAKSVYSLIKTHTTANQFAILYQIATAAVQASEQGALGGFVTDKKSAALQYANESLSAAGLKVSAEELSSAIEAAVLREFNPERDTSGSSDSSPELPAAPTK